MIWPKEIRMKLKGAFAAVVFIFVILSGCDLVNADKQGSCKFLVYSYGDGVDVLYRIDGKSYPTIKQDQPDGESSYYIVDKDFELPTTISITANALSLNTSSITIEIYQNDKIMKSNTVTKTDADVKIVNSLNYEFGSSDSAESSVSEVQ